MTKETLVIRSSEWLRASSYDCSETFQSGLFLDGQYCCLGLDARRCGIPNSRLFDQGTPDDLFYVALEKLLGSNYSWDSYGFEDGVLKLKANNAYFARWNTDSGLNTDDAELAMKINDNPDTTDEEKISLLRPIFAKHNIEIDFRPDE